MSKQWSTGARPAKQRGRVFAYDGVSLDQFFDRKRRVNTALMLPSTEAQCIQHAVRERMFNLRTTQLICVEGFPQFFDPMTSMVDSLNFRKKPIYIPNMLEGVDLSEHEIDYAFLDIYGTLTQSYAEWIRDQLIPSLASNANVAFTFFKASRGCRWLREQRVTQDDLRAFRYHMLPSGRGGMSKTIAYVLRLFKEYQVTPTCYEYRDQNCTPMFVFCLDHIRPKKESPMTTTAEYQRRARKAVTTRQANARTEDYRQRGLKAAETRRANILFAKRSAAANKAVATRRRNAANA